MKIELQVGTKLHPPGMIKSWLVQNRERVHILGKRERGHMHANCFDIQRMADSTLRVSFNTFILHPVGTLPLSSNNQEKVSRESILIKLHYGATPNNDSLVHKTFSWFPPPPPPPKNPNHTCALKAKSVWAKGTLTHNPNERKQFSSAHLTYLYALFWLYIWIILWRKTSNVSFFSCPATPRPSPAEVEPLRRQSRGH